MPFDFTKLPGEQLGVPGEAGPGFHGLDAGGIVFGVLLLLGAAGVLFLLVSRRTRSEPVPHREPEHERPWWMQP